MRYWRALTFSIFCTDSRRPANFDQFRAGIFAEPRKHAFVAGGKISDRRIHRKVLRQAGSRYNLDSGADAIAIRFPAHKLNANPVVSISAVISQHVSFLPKIAHDDIDIAIVVNVAKSCAAARPISLKSLSSDHPDKVARDIAEQQRRLEISQVRRGLFDRVHHMRLGDKKVLPSVVVVIEQMRAPAGKSQCGATDAGSVGDIAKGARAVIVKQHVAFIGKVCDHDIGQAVVVIIAEVDSHPRESFAVLVIADAGEQPDFAERAVAVVAVEEALHRVVGNKNVGEAISVVVSERNAETLAMRIGYSGLLRNVGKGAVPVVVIQNIRQPVVIIRVAIGRERREAVSLRSNDSS